jgi:hypothetical protein
MLDQWILSKLDPLRPTPLIIVRDPQRMVRPRVGRNAAVICITLAVHVNTCYTISRGGA